MGIKDDGLKTVIRVCISPIAFEPGWLPQSSLIAGVWISCVCVCVCGEWKGFAMFCNNSDRLSLNCQPICDNLESSYLRSNLYSVGRVSVNCWSTVCCQMANRFLGELFFLPWRWGGRVKYKTILVGVTWWIVGGAENTQKRPFDISSMVLKDSQQRRHEKRAKSAEFFNFCQLCLIICCSFFVLPTENRDLRTSYVHSSPTQGFLIGVIIQLMRAESNSESFSSVFVIVLYSLHF